jgi:hypothetical protein
MAIRSGPADLRSRRQISGGSLMLVAVLLLVLVAAFVLATGTPWVMDQPLPPYNWAIVP